MYASLGGAARHLKGAILGDRFEQAVKICAAASAASWPFSSRVCQSFVVKIKRLFCVCVCVFISGSPWVYPIVDNHGPSTLFGAPPPRPTHDGSRQWPSSSALAYVHVWLMVMLLVASLRAAMRESLVSAMLGYMSWPARCMAAASGCLAGFRWNSELLGWLLCLQLA